MRRIKTKHTYCAHHGVNQGHNSAECNVICREFDQYYASSTSTCRPGDSGHTQPDPEDVVTRAAGLILRAGAAGAEAGSSGSFRRLIYRLICREDKLPTDRATTFGELSLRHRKHGILGLGGSSQAMVTTTTGGRVRVRIRGCRLREALWRGPTRRRCRQVRILPS